MSRMKESFRGNSNVRVDTCAAAFKFDQPACETRELMTSYDMVVVDEISLLDLPHFETLLKMWHAADKLPALVILGDKYQLPAVDAVKKGRPWQSAAWKKCRLITLHQASKTEDGGNANGGQPERRILQDPEKPPPLWLTRVSLN